MPYDQNQLWKPTRPYILGSGKYAGKVLEYVFLHDISSFLAMKCQLEANAQKNCKPNTYHQHIMWLVNSINILADNVVCKECGKRANFLPARGNYQEGLYFLPYPLCRQCAERGEWAIAFKFDIVPWHICYLPLSKTDRNKLWKAQKKVLKINNKSDQQLFELLVGINH